MQNPTFSSRVVLKTPLKDPKGTPKTPPKPPPWHPGELPKHVAEKGSLSSSIFLARGSKCTPKGSPEILKNRSRTSFFAAQKTVDFPKHFFLVFIVFGVPRTSEIVLKRCTVVQNRGVGLFQKNLNFSQKGATNDSQSDPRNHLKPKTTLPKNPSENTLEKRHGNTQK